jgi:RNA polymerase sigma-B factor
MPDPSNVTTSSDTTRGAPPGVDAADRVLAEQTIPGARGEEDLPGVDPDVWLLHVCYSRHPDSTLRRLLVEEYDSYARSLASRMHREGESLEDLCQVAFEALLISLDRFDPERGVPFTAFASLTITGALKRHYRDVGWLMRVPRRVHELAAPAKRVTDELTVELGQAPTLEAVATRLGVDVEELIEAQEAVRARSLGSLSNLLTGEDGEPRDVLGGVDPAFVEREETVDLREALGTLDDDERELVRAYFFEECTQTELAERREVSQMQISRQVRSVTRRLAARLHVQAS